MISAIYSSPVNTPKPQCDLAFRANNVNKLVKAGEKHIENANSIGRLPNTFEKFLTWLVGFKG